MIGVTVQPTDRDAVGELFELCKTPWEFYQGDRPYEVVICTAAPPSSVNAPLILIFNAETVPFDGEHNLTLHTRREGTRLLYAGKSLPIYGPASTFSAGLADLLREESSQQPAIFAHRDNGVTVVRIGYDLPGEIRWLLTKGQPFANAGTATLELHLALLRDLITRAGLSLVEIPPVPAGSEFIACLTHDIDHPVLRNHRWDHTMFGFLYRATAGSLLSLWRGRMSLGNVAKNWAAALRLPFIHLGLARDFWHEFDRYLEIEKDMGATYFVIPENGYPGQRPEGTVSAMATDFLIKNNRTFAMRACRYDLAELKPQLDRIVANGSEVGVHGIDAWLSADAGRRELARVTQAGGDGEMGTRMHWLYFATHSHAVLEEAGFSYDSTVGFTETIGYRAGTTQAYRPLGATKLLELPLHIMDTALFYPSYLNLGEEAAFRLVGGLLDDIARFGGVLTFNWHDRSIAPDRLWGGFYERLLGEMKKRGAWFPTAGRAVAWFRKRRRAVIESVRVDGGLIRVRGRLDGADNLPGLKIRIHRPCRRSATAPLATGPGANFIDVKFDNQTEQEVKI